jgi:integrase
MAQARYRSFADTPTARRIDVGRNFSRMIPRDPFRTIKQALAEAQRLYDAKEAVAQRHKQARRPVDPNMTLVELGPKVLTGRISRHLQGPVRPRTEFKNLTDWRLYLSEEAKVEHSRFLGRKKLRDITPQDVDDYLLSLCRPEWGLEPNSRVGIGDVLRIVLREAVNGGACDPRVITDQDIRWPRTKLTGGRNGEHEEMLPVERFQIARRALANHYGEARAGTFLRYVFGLYCGLRRGEIMGLRWIDLSAETVRPDVFCRRLRVVEQPGFRSDEAAELKTGYAKRSGLPLPRWIAPVLERWFERQVEARRTAGLPVESRDWRICGNVLGELVGVDSMASEWRTGRVIAGLDTWTGSDSDQGVGMHDLRRAFETYMDHVAPAARREIDRMMGHSPHGRGMRMAYSKAVNGRADDASADFFALLDGDMQVTGRVIGPATVPLVAAE